MKKILSPLAVIVLALTLSSCKYDFKEVYRYPCQDPANFGTPECEPPACKASGMCTSDILPDLNQSPDQGQNP